MSKPHLVKRTPPAEVEVGPDLVRGLLQEQHPDLAELSIEFADSGWDNFMFRLGQDLALRMPRRQASVAGLLHEQRVLPELAPRLPLPISVPLRVGEPGLGYPWPWSVVPWRPGSPADLAAPNKDQSIVLADFLRALHQPAPASAPTNPFRGVPLVERDAAIAPKIARLKEQGDLITPAIESAWTAALEAPLAEANSWLHGDLHPRNVLVERGAFSAIVDWGDVTSGDVAVDLASAWMLFDDAEARVSLFERYGDSKAQGPKSTEPPSEATRVRAIGCAVAFGATLLNTGLTDDPRHAEVGRRTLIRVAEDLTSG